LFIIHYSLFLRPVKNIEAMSKKPYKMSEENPLSANEPAIAYSVTPAVAAAWNPNVPFHGTQEEWWEHFHRIEEGNFMTLEEFDLKFETWRKEYLANKLK
jgi:hypothetical protein